MAILAIALTACHTLDQQAGKPHPNGEVNHERVTRDDVDRYQLSQGETAHAATITHHVDPDHPAHLLNRDLPSVNVTAQLVITANGDVGNMYIDDYIGQARFRPAFTNAVKEVATQWHFEPFTITRTVTHGDGSSTQKTQAMPVSRWYRFHFDVIDGKPVTSSRTQQ